MAHCSVPGCWRSGKYKVMEDGRLIMRHCGLHARDLVAALQLPGNSMLKEMRYSLLIDDTE